MKRRLFLITLLAAVSLLSAAASESAFATFAGGCFWCMEKPFDQLDGVISTTSGFSGGRTENPSYKEVSNGGTGHIEVIQIEYDPEVVTYDDLLYIYWRNIDPLDGRGQFCDRGETYTTAIFYHDEDQQQAAESGKQEIRSKLSRRITTDIRPFEAFYPAEDRHQDYYLRNPVRYSFYRKSCGRDKRLDELWGDEARGGDHE